MSTTASDIAANEKKPMPFVCPAAADCKRAYKTAKALREHVRAKHGEARAGVRCDACDASFAHVASLRRHQAAQHDKRRFACKLCAKEYRYASALATHKRAAHEQRQRFACAACERTFKHKSTLTAHCKLKHE